MSLETVRIDDLEALEKARIDQNINNIISISQNILPDHGNDQPGLETENFSYSISWDEDLYEDLMSGK